jgi:transcriptional regulator with XRE-family HTH domain
VSGLRVLRQSRGLGLRQAARLAHVSPAHLSRIENGLRNPSVELLLVLLGLYRADASARMLRAVVAKDGKVNGKVKR